MNPFERELRKLYQNSGVMDGIQFIDRICMGRISETLRARVEFVIDNTIDRYEALKISVLDREKGVVDSTHLRFGDCFPPTGSNTPCFYDMYGDVKWSACNPGPEEYARLTELTCAYLDFFREPVQQQDAGGPRMQ